MFLLNTDANTVYFRTGNIEAFSPVTWFYYCSSRGFGVSLSNVELHYFRIV